MSSASLDERYLDWLKSQVVDVKPRSRTRTFNSLLQQLYETIFVALVPYDENRIADAKALKYEFLADAEDEQGDYQWTHAPSSMLEVLLVLSRQLSFEMDDDVRPWFWHLIEMLDLEQFNDREYDEHAKEVIDEALARVIWRRYEPSGRGGLFPLRSPERDQRKVELWYQLNAYLLENF